MNGFPAARMSFTELAPQAFAAMLRLERSIDLDPTVRELVKLRASQINGCVTCIDMHYKDARAAGESEERLYSLNAWRESPLYSERERAALALCEAITLVAETHVPDDVWNAAADCFELAELTNLVFAVTAINAWNRIVISARVEPGHYRPGMLSAA
jgi:AhpD family alkylhydroperoxidase